MAVLKCKMCGGDLNLVEGASTAECEFCGSVQTVPKVDDEKKLTLFARANRLRAACDFDKAAGVYEALVADFPEEAEAYWGMVLCKYGIEYVDDPATGKKIPTCHRSSFDSVMDDTDFEQALESADLSAQKLYRQEAKEFERIRKGILEVSSSEKPYDIFICYKETDEKGDRTLDSVLAQDLYSALIDKGYRVFFSRITLQGKLGEAYEPYIFAALNSAKVMLAVGTCYEYYNAVWVKNEWSRYLKICAADKSKHLIPCYKDLDPEDMPKEFNHLQGADLGKMGAMQDILFNMEKYIPLQKKTTVVIQKEVANAVSNPTVESYLKRAFMFLGDGDWNSANEYCEKVLDIDPENAQAYLGKLMAELRVKNQENLKDCKAPFDSKNNYQKALRFGDSNLCSMLKDCTKRIHERIEQEQLAQRIARENKQQREWDQAKKLLQQGAKRKAYTLLKKLSGYKDADTLLETVENDILAILAPVEREGKWGYINEAGKMVIKPQFDLTFGFASNGLAHVKREGKWGYINEAGEMVVEPQFDEVNYFASNGLASVKREGKWGCINEAGEMVIEPQFDYALGFDSNGLAPVKREGKWGCINEAGEMVVEPQFDEVIYFASNGFAPVKREGKWGYINEAGKMVIEPQFDYAFGFASNGLARVKREGKWGCINEAGKMVIKPQFDDAFGFEIIFRSEVNHAKQVQEAAAQKERIAREKRKEEERIAREKKRPLLLSVRKRILPAQSLLSVTNKHTAAVKSDGTALVAGCNEDGQCNVSKWKDIVAIALGSRHTVGLKSDGTVVATGSNSWGQCDVSKWKDVVAISAVDSWTIGLKSDGTVVATGWKSWGQCDASKWKDVVAISAGCWRTVGIKSNGTVIATGDNDEGQCNVSEWKDIVAIALGSSHTVGLKSDGTVVATGKNNNGQCNVSDWRDIVAISAGYNTVGLKADGTIVIAGINESYKQKPEDDIIAITSYDADVFCVKADGTAIVVGGFDSWQDVSDWEDIIAICGDTEHIVGIKSDGTVVSKVDPDPIYDYGQEKVGGWKLFGSLDTLEQERAIAQRRAAGLCQHCGGELKGLFGKKCVSCGKPKGY